MDREVHHLGYFLYIHLQFPSTSSPELQCVDNIKATMRARYDTMGSGHNIILSNISCFSLPLFSPAVRCVCAVQWVKGQNRRFMGWKLKLLCLTLFLLWQCINNWITVVLTLTMADYVTGISKLQQCWWNLPISTGRDIVRNIVHYSEKQFKSVQWLWNSPVRCLSTSDHRFSWTSPLQPPWLKKKSKPISKQLHLFLIP